MLRNDVAAAAGPSAAGPRQRRRNRAVKYDEQALAAHFKRGGTLAEFLKLNPSDYEAGTRARGLSPAGRARMLKEHIEWVERVERGGRKLSKSELQILRQRFGGDAPFESSRRRSNGPRAPLPRAKECDRAAGVRAVRLAPQY
jgi:hypothetical protein